VQTEPVLAVHRCPEVQRWDFDPMLVEVEACVTNWPPQTYVLEVAKAVDLCLFRPKCVRLGPNLTKAPTSGAGAD
jgi:hypothetical protein